MEGGRLLRLSSRIVLARRAVPTGGNDIDLLIQNLEESYLQSPLRKYVPFVSDEVAEPALDAPHAKLCDALPSDVWDLISVRDRWHPPERLSLLLRLRLVLLLQDAAYG